MADQIVITEKSSQAKDVRAAVGSRYGDILPAEGHLFDLLEPGDVVPAWKRWSPILLRPEGLYGTRPAEGGNKAAKLRAIREAVRTARCLAWRCDQQRPRDVSADACDEALCRQGEAQECQKRSRSDQAGRRNVTRSCQCGGRSRSSVQAIRTLASFRTRSY
jgi:DNA topoisomerase IA